MNKELWKIVEGWNFWNISLPKGIERELVTKILHVIKGPEAIYLYGPRRAGKTYTCYQLMAKLGQKNCLYINFEEPVFAGNLTTSLISEIVEEFTKKNKKKPKYIFLDEAQNVKGWEKWVRSAVDKKEYKIFVTGSSAKLLSSEFTTSLGGRGIGFFVLPFSFREFKKALPKASIEEYFELGGYPEVVTAKNSQRQKLLLEEYFNTAIARDIVARYDVRDAPTLRTLAVHALTNSGKLFSYNKLRTMTGLSFDSIKSYLSYLEDAFIIFQVPAFSYSLKKAMEKPRKYYAYDSGMQTMASKSYTPDLGRKAETAVAIELARQEKEIQYYSNKYEIDFVIKEGLELTAINASYTDTPPEREANGLEEFKKQHKNTKTILLDKKKIHDFLLKK